MCCWLNVCRIQSCASDSLFCSSLVELHSLCSQPCFVSAPQPAVDLANKRDRKQEIKKRQKVYEKGRKYDNDIGRLQREIEQLKDVKGKDSLAKRYHYLQGRYDTLFRITTFLIRRSNVDCDDIDLSAFAESCGPLAADAGSEALLCHDMPTAVDVVPALTDATTSVAHTPTDTITTSEVS